ncbi:hypothetical protein ParKJ_20555 [Paraburkholderia fungorum]|jgi:hypothetical protein|uniref:Uncharacterized protein n=1 Tax=Paraburkholderia fungorum TaxID=134537 RepID=A0AAP5Q8V7_9BURK|nr:hypothetical protein [Paraburkholderia fungorum]MDT8839821.1 hypothetical protein [Paraburkholderia fungorum]
MKQPQQPRRAAARLSRQRGQAYAEYLVVTMVLIAALIVATVDMPAPIYSLVIAFKSFFSAYSFTLSLP